MYVVEISSPGEDTQKKSLDLCLDSLTYLLHYLLSNIFPLLITLLSFSLRSGRPRLLDVSLDFSSCKTQVIEQNKLGMLSREHAKHSRLLLAFKLARAS
jgi:hypothetical protein